MITARNEYMERPVLASDLNCPKEESRTKQADLKDTDINLIFKRYERSGLLPDLILKDGRYGDFSSVPDYQDAMNIVILANEQFAALDVNIRNRFGNDPAKFLEFVDNPDNLDEMERMGLLKPEVVAAREAARSKKSADEIAAREAAAAGGTV